MYHVHALLDESKLECTSKILCPCPIGNYVSAAKFRKRKKKRERKSTGVCRAVECHVKLESSKIDHRNVETSRAHVCDISKKEAQNGKTDCDASQIKCPTASLSLGTRKLHSCLFFSWDLMSTHTAS